MKPTMYDVTFTRKGVTWTTSEQTTEFGGSENNTEAEKKGPSYEDSYPSPDLLTGKPEFQFDADMYPVASKKKPEVTGEWEWALAQISQSSIA
jgi:hypothetical protein